MPAGFIHDKLEIKFLILFITARVLEPVDLPTLADLTLCDAGVDYFQFAAAVFELVETGHLDKGPEETYRITEKGRKNGAVCEDSLAYSVRMRANRGIELLNARLRRNAQVQAVTVPRPSGGYTVRLSLDDNTENLFALELFSGSLEQAHLLEQSFRRQPEQCYNQILALLFQENGGEERW